MMEGADAFTFASSFDNELTKAYFTQGESMFEGLLQPMHLIMIVGIALLVLGPRKLPELGKGLGEGIRGFKSAMAGKEELNSTEQKSGSTHRTPTTEN